MCNCVHLWGLHMFVSKDFFNRGFAPFGVQVLPFSFTTTQALWQVCVKVQIKLKESVSVSSKTKEIVNWSWIIVKF